MTEPQHMVALARANAVRKAGREVKREIASGQLSIAAAMDDERAQPIRIFDLLTAQRWWGVDRTRKVLRALFIGEQRRVRDLTERQRQVLAVELNKDPRQRRRGIAA